MENAVLFNPERKPVDLPGGNDHPVVDLPFTAVIDGRQFRGRGLSLVAAYVAGLMDPAAINATRIVRLMFQFDGFAVTLVVDAEVREGEPHSGEVELIFIRPTGSHLPQLRHLLNAFIAGDLVGLGQAISVAGTAAPKSSKATRQVKTGLTMRRVVGGLGVGLLSLALLALAGTIAYQRMFVALVPTLGTVVSTGEVLRSTTTGQIVFLDLTAGEGDVVVAVQAASGDVQSLVMPCDCVVTSNNLREGSTVLIGEPLLQLASDSDQILVSAAIPSEMLFNLASADRIEMRFPDGARILATPDLTRPTIAGADTQSVLLIPDAPLDSDRIGDPVQVRVRQDLGAVGTWLESTDDRLETASTAIRASFVSLFKGE